MKKNLSLFIMITIVLIIAGCSTNSTNTQSDSGASDDPTDASAAENTLRIAMGTDILGFDIHNHQTTTTEAVHINMFDYLVWNKGDYFNPHLAESFDLIDDVTWQFKLREDVYFHNGDKLTAEDVKFTLERVARDESLRSNNDYKQIKEVIVLDEYNFQIITHEPSPVLLNRISRQASGILPKKYIEENGWDYFLEHPVGTGPYQFVEWKKDEQIVLEVFDDYFLGKKSDWDKVVFRVIPEDSTRVAELLTDGVDIADNVPPVDWDRVNKNENTAIVTGPTNRTMLIFLRSTEGYPTSDVRVRQAIDYAIDNQALVDYIIGGGGTPSLTRVNPGNFGAHEELYGKYNYDPERAKQLLAEAGYGDGVKITLHSPSGRYLQDRETMEMVAGMLSEVGIEVEMQFMEWGNFVELRNAGKHKDGYLIGLGASLFDAAQALEYYSWSRSEGLIDWYNEEVNSLMDEADKTLDRAVREDNYKRVQEIAAEEVPIIVLFQVDAFYGANNRVSFTPRLDEAIWVPDITLNP